MHEHTTREQRKEWEFASSWASVVVDVRPFAPHTPGVRLPFGTFLCSNLGRNLQKPLLQSKNINKLLISNHAKLIMPQ